MVIAVLVGLAWIADHQATEDRDRAAYAAAAKQDTESAYRDYLDACAPNGCGHAAKARGRIDALKSEAQQAREAAEAARRRAAQGEPDNEPEPADAPAPGESFRDALDGGGKGPEMVVIPAGSFRMGSDDGDSDEKPVHPVRISRAFALGKYEVTFDDYDRFARATGRDLPADQGWGRGQRPVINVSWEDASAYAEWLTQQTGHDYRLPSEAEWEYAARARTMTAYWWGDDASHEYANYGEEDCCGGLAKGRDRWEHTAPVGSFAANPFGLHDTAGNVWEWVQDWYDGDAYGSHSATDPVVRQGGSYRVIRGGGWNGAPRSLRSANRGNFPPGDSNFNLGLRLARSKYSVHPFQIKSIP